MKKDYGSRMMNDFMDQLESCGLGSKHWRLETYVDPGDGSELFDKGYRLSYCAYKTDISIEIDMRPTIFEDFLAFCKVVNKLPCKSEREAAI